MEKFIGLEIVNRIDYLLKNAGLTRKDLANYIGKNSQVFVDWKNRNIMPKCDDLYNMSKFLGVPMEYLLTGEEIIPDEIAAAGAILMTLESDQRQAVIAMIKAQADFWKNKNDK